MELVLNSHISVGKFEGDPFDLRVFCRPLEVSNERGGEAGGERNNLYHRHDSNMVATPIPSPVHIVTAPRWSCRRCNSSTSVPTNIAPVAPTGCPMAIAPPATFTFS